MAMYEFRCVLDLGYLCENPTWNREAGTSIPPLKRAGFIQWFHGACIGVTEEEADLLLHFYCDNCIT